MKCAATVSDYSSVMDIHSVRNGRSKREEDDSFSRHPCNGTSNRNSADMQADMSFRSETGHEALVSPNAIHPKHH